MALFVPSLTCSVNKKYFPFAALLLAVVLLWWIKTHQRGTQTRATVSTMALSFNRNLRPLKYSDHAHCRMSCRHIDESEVMEILKDGTVNYNKVEQDDRGITFPVEGVTHDRQHVRIVFAPHEHELVVVTAIDLDHEWPCDCN